MSRKHIAFIFSIFFFVVGEKDSLAQNIDAFARVSVSPREGVVRQPYKVNISVYSSTWFAKPLQFTNLRIDNAFIIPFTRTVSGINYLNNRKYATLTFYYLVFPYSTGALEIPELVIEANIPPEGDYRGQAITIRTKAQRIKVNAVPASKQEDVWMVAKNIKIKESWSRPLTSLKVGDVIEREIVITAEGTLPSLIQPLEVERPLFTSFYPQQADLKDTRDSQDANGVRTERYSYLFEEEGEVIIPKEEILWWNPVTRAVYRRTIEEQKLNVAPNPDLSMMESLKDSLMAMSTPMELKEAERPTAWIEIGIFLIMTLLTIHYSRKAILLALQYRKEKRETYMLSEAFYFRKVKEALKSSDAKEFVRELYVWFDKARLSETDAALYSYLDSGDIILFEAIIQHVDRQISTEKQKVLMVVVEKLRDRLLNGKKGFEEGYRLNPTSV